MNRRKIFQLTTASLLFAAAVFSAGNAPAQKSFKDQLLGAWTLVSIENTAQDGKKAQPFGANPKGVLILDASGHFAQAQTRANRQKFKSMNRLQASSEESKAAMNDVLVQFGAWSVDEGSKTILLRIDGHIVPNGEGSQAKRVVTAISADELRVINPAPGLGGTNESVYRRAK